MIAHNPGRQRGAAVIELAAILGLVATLLIGVIELARASQQFAALSAAARAAARFAAASPTPQGVATAQCLAVYGKALSSCSGESAGAPLLPGFSMSQVLISVPVDLRDESGNLVQSASPGLSAIQARAADGSPSGTLDIVTVTLGPPGARYRFVPLLRGVTPSFEFAPISVSMAVSGG
jgi:hypothetical protein